ncbi:M56 family metallopeptidase [Mariniblastus fucicola]|uniref:Regulatory protein BlaR1 n=1 Tax=Mariniblastus fucicola TaxID=980251 RepID=A0A5B9P170_9BACT|nr:M56 family metallopeptidase [Mariniblastus fucicola]QEG20247.1 Regulatory protein BlaR1 [Mariniblastus fucicola]
MNTSRTQADSFWDFYTDLATSIGWTSIHFLWQGLLIAAATMLLLRTLRRHSATVHYAVACGGLLVMALAPVVTFCAINGRASLPISNRVIAVSTEGAAIAQHTAMSAAKQKPLAAESTFEKFRTPSSAPPINSSWTLHLLTSTKTKLESLAPWVGLLWFVGVVLAASRLLSGWAMLNRLRFESTKAQFPQLAACMASLKKQFGLVDDVVVGVSRKIANPLVIGWFQPLILLPVNISEELSLLQIRAVLAHELAHVRRGDFAVNVLQCVIETLLFFHPCVWWASAKVRHERENCCDDLAAKIVGSRRSYAEALLVLEQSRLRHGQLALNAEGGNLAERIRRLTRPSTRTNQRSSFAPAMLGLCVLLVLLPGVVAIASTAMQEQESEKDPMILNRDIAVTVVDSEGKPIPEVKIHAGVWSGDGTIADVVFPPNRNYITDESGQTNVELPHNYYIVRLWITGDGYVPMFAAWEEHEILDGKTPPRTLSVTMLRGSVGGGFVLDARGKPVAGAKVSLRGGGVEIKGPTRFMGIYGVVETDKEGKWSFDNLLPDVKATFSAEVEHTDYLPRKSVAVDRDTLIAKSAKIALSSGIEVTGKVTDINGNVVDDGLVVLGDDPYLESGSQEIEIDDNGQFRTLPQVPSKKRVTVVAKGYAPTSKMVDIAVDMPPVNFELKPGRKLRIKVTDENDIPIPGAYASLRRWRNSRCLYSQIHPNVKPTGIPYKANDEGIFEWDWAPADDVVWSISMRGYLSSDETPLAAGDHVHVIRLKKKPSLRGSIRYADTGKPARFTKVTPIIEHRAGMPGNRRDSDAVVADAQGEFVFQLSRSNLTYRLEFSKEGYRPFISQAFDTEKFPETMEISLEKSNPSTGSVVDFGGMPVAGAEVFLVDKFNSLRLNNYRVNFRVPDATTDSNGKFEFEALVDPTTLVVLHKEGFAERKLSKTELAKGEGPRIEIDRWASIKGTVTIGGQPVSDTSISHGPLAHFPTVVNQIHSRSSSTTDSNGDFHFSKVGSHPASLTIVKRGAYGKSTHCRINVPFNPQPGEASTVNLNFDYPFQTVLRNTELFEHVRTDGANCAFTKTANWEELLPADFNASNPHRGNYSDTLDFARQNQDWKTYFILSNATESTSGFIKDDGSVEAFLSGPGTYQFAASFQGRPLSSLADVTICSVLSYHGTLDVKDGIHELPSIDVPFEPPVSIGEPAPNAELGVGEEERLSLADLRGKVVLLDFWNGTSKQIPASNAAIESLKSSVQNDDPLAILSLHCFPSSMDKLIRKFPPELSRYVKTFSVDPEMHDSVCPKFGAWAVPLAVVIDQKGIVRFTGSHDRAVEIVSALLDTQN